jgi:Winged helix-turn helix
MAVRRRMTLTAEQQRQLVAHRDHDPRPYVRERCAALLKVAGGESVHAVARRGLLKPRDPDTVYGWLDLYQAEGLHGLVKHPPGGGHRGSSAEHRRNAG